MRLEINQIWQNCYEVRNQPNLAELLRGQKSTKSGRIITRLEINQIWQNCYEVRNQPNLAELL